jgi:hypothetical protein
MEFKHTIEVLNSQAREIEDFLTRFEQLEQIPLIEIDLLLEKLRTIYDLTADLRTALQKEHSTGVTRPTTQQSEDKPYKTDQTEESAIKSPKPSKEEVREKVEKDMSRKMSKDNATDTDPKFISDRFKSSKPILNEEIMGKTKFDDISAQYKMKPIGSIKTALGLNEKFELINHLFEGNKEKFEKTLDVLDMAGSFVEAYNYLEAHFDWDMDDVYVQRILELIRRKLIVRRNEQ